MAPWWVCGLLPLLAVAAAAAAAAEGNAEPLIRSPAQDEQDAAPAPAPSAEDRVTRRAVLVAGYSCYHHQADLCTSSCLCRAYQILMRREMNEERIVVCMGKDMARNPQNPRRGVIITAEENTEPLILLPTQNEHDAAPAPAPSVKDSSGYENYRHQILKRGGLKEGVTRWAVLVAGSSGYKNYGHQADVCHAYQILKRGGLKEETILVCMYDDDMAKPPQNPRPGVIIIISEENTEPLILLATQNGHVAAPAPSAEERIPRADPSGYGNYRHQILKRGGMNDERIMVCMYDAIAKNFQNPRPGVIVAAERNTEPLHDAAPAPAPSVEDSSGYENYRHQILKMGGLKEGVTRWAVLVAGSSGYKNYGHQADVCHAYQILKRGGLKEETILVCMYDDDDLAKTPQNPRPGVIIIAEENTEPLILLATQNEHVAAPAPSAEERITRADPSGYGNYHHQILKRGGMNEERIMVCMYDAIAKNFQNPRPGVIVAAEGNTEPLHDAAAAPAPSAEEGATKRAVLGAGYSCYRHQADLCTSSCVCRAYQILMRREMNEERIVVCMGKDMARNPQNPRRGVIITAEGNTEPLILLPTQNEHDAAPAPAPSVEDSSGYENYRHQILKRGGTNEESILLCMDDTIAKNSQNPRPGVSMTAPSAEQGVTRRAVLVAGSYGYESYRRQAMETRAGEEADHSDGFDKKGLTMAGCLVVGGALLALGIVFLHRVYRFFTLEALLRRRNLPFALYPPKETAYQAGDVHTVCAVCLSRFGWCARIAVLPACGHIFHRRCLRVEAALESPRCPMCRAAVA